MLQMADPLNFQPCFFSVWVLWVFGRHALSAETFGRPSRFGLSNENSASARLHQSATKDDSEWKFSFGVSDSAWMKLKETKQWKTPSQTS